MRQSQGQCWVFCSASPCVEMRFSAPEPEPEPEPEPKATWNHLERHQLRSTRANPVVGSTSPGAIAWAMAPPISGVRSGALVRMPVVAASAPALPVAQGCPRDDVCGCGVCMCADGGLVPATPRHHKGVAAGAR